MAILSRLLDTERRAIERGPRPLSAANIIEYIGGGPTASGRAVNEETALRLATVYACVRVIAESVASLPLVTYRRLARGKERAPMHPLYPLLHDAPNPWMTGYSFREMLQGHLLLWGNAFARIIRDEGGAIRAFHPLRPDRMKRPEFSPAGTLVYEYQRASGQPEVLPQVNVLHLRGLSTDGLWGYSPIQLQREQLGLALVEQEFSARFFGNSARPGGVLETKGRLGPEAATNLAASWNALHQGVGQSHKVAILEEGLTWKQIGMPLQDAQLLQARQFERSEIAGWFRVPPHMIGDVDRSTSWGSGIEQQTIGFITYTLRPWLVNWEQAIMQACLLESERERFLVEHLLDGLMRGDAASRGQFYVQMIEHGVFSPNEVREKENLNPAENGDELLVPLNLGLLSQLGQQPEAMPEEPEDMPMPAGGRSDNASEHRSSAGRRRLREIWHGVIRETAQRLVDRQVSEIESVAPTLLARRSVADLDAWLDRFHRDELQPLAEQLFTPIFSAYAGSVEREALAETGVPILTETMAPFLAAYSVAFALHYVTQSGGQLRALVLKAQASQKDVAGAVLARLAEWQEKRAGKVADVESIRLGEAAAIQTYKRAGIGKVTWRTIRKNCPFCRQIDGRAVAIGQKFAGPGDQLDDPQGTQPLVIRRRTGHPPLHASCDCYVSPVR